MNDGDTALTLQTGPDIWFGVVVDVEALGSCLSERVGEHVERLPVLAEVLGDVRFRIRC